MSKQKFWWLVALLATMALLAASCGDDDETAPGDAPGDTASDEADEPAIDEVPEDLNQASDEPEPEPEPEPEDDGDEIQTGGTLVAAMQTLPTHFNGNIASGTAPNTPGTQLFASPLKFDDEWNPEPYLADSWEFSDDGLSLTLHLNPDATFHDGEPIESHDVAFSIAMNQANHPFKPMFGSVTSVDTPDANTAVINLSATHPAILIAMSPALLPIFPEHVYGEVENIRDCTCNSQPGELVGSGPFVLEEFNPTDGVIRMSANEDFFLGRPHVDELVIAVRPSANELITEMENGEIHIGNVQGVADLERVTASDSLTVTAKGTEGIGAVVSMQFNLEDEVLGIKEVRQAIAYAIDKDFIIEDLHGGLPFRAKSPIHPGSPYYDDSIEGYEFDLDRSAELLDQAGFPAGADGKRGISLTIDAIPTAEDYQSVIAEYAKSALAEVGIDVELRASPDIGTWAVAYLAARDYDITMNILFMWADPVIGVHRSFLEGNIVPIPFANNSAYINADNEEAMAAAGIEADFDARKAAYSAIQKTLAEDVPFHWIETLPTNSVYNTAVVQNPPLTIWGAMSPLHEVWLAK